MSGAQLTISCPRCSFTQNLPAENIVEGPISQTCPSCGLLFRVGRSLSDEFPSDPTFETEGGWYVRKEGTEVLYFPSLEILRRWSLEGHVNSSDEVSKRGNSWRPIYELPEFSSMMLRMGGLDSEKETEVRTPTSELEQVSEEMIEVEEFPLPADGSKSAWIWVAIAVAAAVAAAIVVGMLPSSPSPEASKTTPADAAETVAAVEPPAIDKAPPKDVSASPTAAVAAPKPDTKASDAVAESPAEVVETATESKDIEESPPKKAPKKKTRASEPRKRKHQPKKVAGNDYDSLMALGAKQLRSTKTAPLAVQTFMAALRFPEATSEARAKLGRAFLLVGDMKSAIKHLEQARKRNPGYRPALWDLARAYQRLQKRQEAISVFRSLSDLLDPESRQGQQVARELERMGVTP